MLSDAREEHKRTDANSFSNHMKTITEYPSILFSSDCHSRHSKDGTQSTLRQIVLLIRTEKEDAERTTLFKQTILILNQKLRSVDRI